MSAPYEAEARGIRLVEVREQASRGWASSIRITVAAAPPIMSSPKATETHRPALLIIDVITDLEFDGAESMMSRVMAMADAIEQLREVAAAAGWPVIFVNDRFGRWRASFEEEVERCLQEDVRGCPLVRRLRPTEEDYTVLKPKHSAFFGTTLETLLQHLGVTRLVLTGLSGDICVLATAFDAYMRGYQLYVPSDATAAIDPEENDRALAYMQRVLEADTRPASELIAGSRRLPASADCA